jgi:hypothetical protein
VSGYSEFPKFRARLTEGLDATVQELGRLGVRATGFRVGDFENPRPGVWVDGRGKRASLEKAFHASGRTFLLEDRRKAWAQVVATIALEVEA